MSTLYDCWENKNNMIYIDPLTVCCTWKTSKKFIIGINHLYQHAKYFAFLGLFWWEYKYKFGMHSPLEGQKDK